MESSRSISYRLASPRTANGIQARKGLKRIDPMVAVREANRRAKAISG
jgi:hypothetical protein